MYEVEYKEGHNAAMAANAIAQNLFAQVDAEGNCYVLLMRSLTTVLMGRRLSNTFLTTDWGLNNEVKPLLAGRS